jgi:hypothetical protein
MGKGSYRGSGQSDLERSPLLTAGCHLRLVLVGLKGIGHEVLRHESTGLCHALGLLPEGWILHVG